MPELRCKTASEESQDAYQPANEDHASKVFWVFDREWCDERVSEIVNPLCSTLGRNMAERIWHTVVNTPTTGIYRLFSNGAWVCKYD